MVEDHFLDFEGSYGQMWTASWRCVNCGRVHDSAIEQNRLARQEKLLALPSGEPDYQDDEVHNLAVELLDAYVLYMARNVSEPPVGESWQPF
jgi:hypothetical protein